ncbi:MAG: OmpA family protein [Paludibacter sp.]|nr:OmpA family protein [Paludibacter sp.]
MTRNSFILFTVIVAGLFVSCKPIYKCGEPKPEKKLFLPKNIITVINERDSLCNTLSVREVEILDMKDIVQTQKTNISKLQTEKSELTTQYNDLMNEKLSQAEQMNTALRLKSETLAEKERLLSEREIVLENLQSKIARQDSVTKRLNDIIRGALLGFKSDELSVEVKNGKVYVSMSDKLLFKSASAAIETKGLEAIKVLADVLNKNNDIDILIEGHTDNLPIRTAQYRDNWDLSVARATSIVRILVDEYKIDAKRLTASGKGEFSPRANNSTPEGRAANRRTEIILSPKLDIIMNLLK